MGKEDKKVKCRYCGLEFGNEKSMEEHVNSECVGKLIHQRTTVIGKLEKFLGGFKKDKNIYDIKTGVQILQSMEDIRKDGKIPVIRLKTIKQGKELKKVIDFRDEIIYADGKDRTFLNFLITLKPKIIVGEFSERDKKIFEMNNISYLSEKEADMEMLDGCAAMVPKKLSKNFSDNEIESIRKGTELKLVLDLSLVDSSGEKKIIKTGKLAIPLIEKKLEKMENGKKKKKKGLSEENLEELEKDMNKNVSQKKESKENIDSKKDVELNDLKEDPKKDQVKEIKKGKSLAEELNMVNLKKDFLKEEKKDEKKDEKTKKGFFSLKKKEETTKKKSLKEAAIENLSKVKELEDFDKATIMVAHVLKQFLEVKMECRKELTYMELIQKLKTFHLPLDYIDQITEFYKNMHIQEYKDEVKVDFKDAKELAERVINDLA